MSVLSKTGGVLTDATNLMLGTSFNTPKLEDLNFFGSGKASPTPKNPTPKNPSSTNSELAKKELADLSAVMVEIRDSLNSYLKMSALAPNLLIDIQTQRKETADFLSGLTEGMKTELQENGMIENEQMGAFLDGFSESIKEFVQSSALLPQLKDSTEDLSKSINQLVVQERKNDPSGLEQLENEREKEHAEEKRHNSLLSALAALATFKMFSGRKGKPGEENEDSEGSPMFGGFLGGLLAGGGVGGLLKKIGLFLLTFLKGALGIGALITAFTLLRMKFKDPEKFAELFGDPEYWKEKMKEAFSWLGAKLWEGLKIAFVEIVDLGTHIIGWFIDGIKELFGMDISKTTKESIDEFWHKTVEWMSAMFDPEKLKESINISIGIIKNKIAGITDGITKKYDEIKESILSAYNNIKESISNSIDSVNTGIQSIIDGTIEKFNSVKESIVGIYRSIVEGITSKIDEAKEKFDQFKIDLTEKISEFLSNLTSLFDPELWKQKAAEKLEGAKAEIGRIYDESMEKAQEFISESAKSISEFFTGLVDTIKLIFGDLGKLIDGAKDAVVGIAKGLFGSSDSNEIDPNIKAIEQEEKDVEERIRVLGRTTRSQPKISEEKSEQIEQLKVRQEELKKAKERQETYKESIKNFDKKIEQATGLEKEDLMKERERFLRDAKDHTQEILQPVEKDDSIQPVEKDDSIQPVEKDEQTKKRTRGPRRKKDESIEPIHTDPYLPIEKIDTAKEENSLYRQFMEENAIRMTDKSASDAASIVAASSSISIDSSLKEQKQITQATSSNVTTVTVAPIFPKGILPGIGMNQ
jgi:hypothetical protein